MSRPPVTPTQDVRGRRTRRDLDATKKRGPGGWVYVGTYPTDPFTTFYSPPWQNGWAHAGAPYDRVAFRWGAHYELEFKGHADSTGATSGTVAFTLPAEYVPAKDVTFLTDVITGAAPATAQIAIASLTGDVTITLL